ncbi:MULTISPECIES: TonB family protein [unclassified Duganella]|uniref:TonB family protein n=1 Tax=unclassified Duganella TaxID=2636909 RepID=UPI000882DBCB|nr:MULTISPECIES: TonB family protein [unclassified Duganella]SDF95475.1 TonB family C-terminal domain-containing protein [Duganella sp. OV458]SDJ09241.1 TonB family C-terminal domain-containing protein [Duganella sp. OV510]
MNKKLLALAAVVLIVVVINLVGRAQPEVQRVPFAALLTPASCAQPQWPAEAVRYEITGTTIISFQIGQDGKVRKPTVSKSSGWQILDAAAIAGITQCVFRSGLKEARDGAVFPLQYEWKFSDAPALRPLLVKDSCQPSAQFAGFREADQRSSGPDGILLRFLLNADSAPVRVVAEPNGQPQALVGQAIAYLQTCRFAYDAQLSGERTDTAFGRVLLK